MAIILKTDSDFNHALGMMGYEELWQHRVADVKKHLDDNPECRTMKHGSLIGLIKLKFPDGLKNLFYQFSYEIKEHIGNTAALIEYFFCESIIYDDGENIDEFLDKHNEFRKLAESDPANNKLFGLKGK